MAAIFGEGKIFGKLQRLHSLDTLWVENFDEIALSGTVKEIEEHNALPCGSKILTKLRLRKQICVLPFLAKIRKFKMAAIFGEGKIFGKLQRLIQNFDEIALSGTVKEIEAFVFCHFWQKFENGRHFWGGENFWKIA